MAHEVHKLTYEEVANQYAGEQIVLLTGLVVLNQVQRLVQRRKQRKAHHTPKEKPVEQDSPQSFVQGYRPSGESVHEYHLKNFLEEVNVDHHGS